MPKGVVDYVSFIATENAVFFISGSSSLVDYISFIATENVVFFDLVDYISFIATENAVFLGWLPCVLTVCWTPGYG